MARQKMLVSASKLNGACSVFIEYDDITLDMLGVVVEGRLSRMVEASIVLQSTQKILKTEIYQKNTSGSRDIKSINLKMRRLTNRRGDEVIALPDDVIVYCVYNDPGVS